MEVRSRKESPEENCWGLATLKSTARNATATGEGRRTPEPPWDSCAAFMRLPGNKGVVACGKKLSKMVQGLHLFAFGLEQG